MRSSLVMSLIGVATLGATLVIGCGDNDAKPVSSKTGESCVRTADCADGLICIANVCYASAPVKGAGGESGSPAVTPPPGPVLGGEGESCTSHTDCADGLGCFNQRCGAAAAPMGEGGAPSTGVDLGARGETCRVNGDCSAGLSCVPTSTLGFGICDITNNYGLSPSGNVCGGECVKNTDCCELPLYVQSLNAVKSCADVDAALPAGSCTTPATATISHLCAAQAMYCSGCTTKTWSCTNSQCVYAATCSAAVLTADAPSGCPSHTRTGSAVPACDATSKKCQTGATPCTTDASCETTPVADDPADSCSAGECTCYAGDHQCYRKCAGSLDCAGGQICDAKASVCVPDATCFSAAACAIKFGSIDYTCKDGSCVKQCSTDRDCSPSGHGLVAGFNGQVCSKDGFCESVAGCTDNEECPTIPTVGGVKTFCVAAPAMPNTPVSSAITN